MATRALKILEDGGAEHREAYAWRSASVNISGTDATTDITTESAFETLFDEINRAHYIKITASGTCYIRLNSSTSDKITLSSTVSFESNWNVVRSIYVSTNGGAITVTIQLA